MTEDEEQAFWEAVERWRMANDAHLRADPQILNRELRDVAVARANEVEQFISSLLIAAEKRGIERAAKVAVGKVGACLEFGHVPGANLAATIAQIIRSLPVPEQDNQGVSE